MGKVMVTVYCLTYNHKDYIRDALEGFVSQKTNFEFEVLVHDDASTDGTADIVREYEENYPSIIKGIYQKENTFQRGINKVYTFLLPRTQGKYIAFCEGDDYWCDENKLQLQVDFMESHPEYSLVAHQALKLLPNGNKISYNSNSLKDDGDLSAQEIIKKHTLFPTASMLFPAKFYTENREFLLNHRSYDYLLKVLLATQGKVHVISKVMSVYRVSAVGSWTGMMSCDAEKYIKHEENAIKSLSDLDEYREHRYHEEIEANILQRRYHIEELQGNYAKLTKGAYKAIYKEGSFKYRMLIRIASILPWSYHALLRFSKK